MNIVPVIIAAQAAQRKEAERALLDAFRLADATAAERAQSLTRLGVERTSAFAQLEAAGVLQSAGRDRYFLSEAAVVAQRAPKSHASTRQLLVVAALVAVALVLLALGISADR